MYTLFTSIHFLHFHPTPTPTPTLPKPTRPISFRVKSQPDPEIDMIKSKDGIFIHKPQKVVILWDLDNKPPRGPPYDAALSLKTLASLFGEVVEISAYANRHAFIHLPNWVLTQRRDQKRRDFMEKNNHEIVVSNEAYICSVCGRKCRTNLALKKHFRELHERERAKKLNRMRSLKGNKRRKFKERFIDGNEKYNEAARSLVTPKVGYGLAQELRRAGVFVKTVADKPQAADWALKKQMQHSIGRGIDWLFLVSDDSDFREMVRRAREGSLGTVVVGDFDRALGREADLWVSWERVENGDIRESDLEFRRERRMDEREPGDGEFSVTEFEGGEDGVVGLDDAIDELVGGTKFDRMRISAFSEGDEDDVEDDDWLRLRLNRSNNSGPRSEQEDGERDFLLDSDDEDEIYF